MARLEEADPRWIVESRGDGKNVNAWHWEEKDMMTWTRKRLGELCNQVVAHQGDDGDKLVIKKLDSLEGDCALHQRKGRRFFTCEIDFKVSWSGELKVDDSVKTASGTISMTDVSNSDPTWGSQVSMDEGDRALRPKFDVMAKVYGVAAVKKAIEQLFTELKEMTAMSEASVLAASAVTPPEAMKSTVAAAGAAAAAAAAASGARADAVARQVPGVQTRTINIEDVFQCSPADLYAALLDPTRIAAYTQAPAKVDRSVGGAFEMLGGSITGVFVELKEAAKIVQRWRMNTWPAGHESLVTLTLTPVADGTRLQLQQTGVPGDEAPRTEYGWRVQFFHRIKLVFGYGA